MSKGFTLIELLVVLVIIGIITMTALMTVRGGGEERLARDEIRRMERLVELAYDESLHQLIELGIEFRRDGYRFLVWDGGEWRPYLRANAFRTREWPGALQAELVVEGRPVTLPSSWSYPTLRPQVVLLSSGEVTTFTLSLVDAGGRGETLRVAMTGTTEREALAGAP